MEPLTTNTTPSNDAKRKHALSLCFSVILCIYSVLSLFCWIHTYGFHYKDTASMFICLSLFFMIFCTLALFVLHSRDYKNDTKSPYYVFIAAFLFIVAGLYLIGTVLAVYSNIYCNYKLCEIQMIQLIILPLTITVTLCLDQFDFEISSCYSQRCAMFKTPNYRIFLYAFIVILEALFNICSPYH
eukprot:107082_1